MTKYQPTGLTRKTGREEVRKAGEGGLGGQGRCEATLIECEAERLVMQRVVSEDLHAQTIFKCEEGEGSPCHQTTFSGLDNKPNELDSHI